MDEPSVGMQEAGFVPNTVSLAQMRAGQTGRIIGIHGGGGMACKLDALGIRVGKQITKISAQWMRGPVLLQQDNTRAALGFGMASRIMVELCEPGGRP